MAVRQQNMTIHARNQRDEALCGDFLVGIGSTSNVAVEVDCLNCLHRLVTALETTQRLLREPKPLRHAYGAPPASALCGSSGAAYHDGVDCPACLNCIIDRLRRDSGSSASLDLRTHAHHLWVGTQQMPGPVCGSPTAGVTGPKVDCPGCLAWLESRRTLDAANRKHQLEHAFRIWNEPDRSQLSRLMLVTGILLDYLRANERDRMKEFT